MEKPEILKCLDCGLPFVFSVGEQDFYGKQNWNKPIRCRECRKRKKLRAIKDEKYDGLFEAISNSHCMKRDAKGRFVNRSASSWERVFEESLLEQSLLWIR